MLPTPVLCRRVRNQARLQTIGSLHRHRSAYLEVTGGPPVETNDTPPYKHWHVVCAACGKITLARSCTPRREIEPVEHNPVIKCQHCEDTRQYLSTACFLAPLSVVSSDKASGTVAVVAGLIAAVKLAHVESREIQSKSPRVRSVISDSITIARMVIEASKRNS